MVNDGAIRLLWRLTIQPFVQDGGHRAVADGLDTQGAGAGGFHPGPVMGLGQTQDAHAAAEGLLGVTAPQHQGFHQGAGVRSNPRRLLQELFR